MKINELKRIAEENNYEFTKELGYFCFKKRNHTNNIDISGDVENKIWISIGIICDDEDFNMIKASVKFAETPIDEREEEKKFLIQHKYFVSKNMFPVNIVWHKLKDVYRLVNCRVDTHIYQAQFTKKEIEEIKEKYNTDLSDFEEKEVEE